jgi:TolB-like protein/Flp pilus assembly protein TadD
MKKRASFNWSDFSGELKRRGVYPVIAAYAVAGWLLLQVGEVTFEPLGVPEWAMTGLIVVVVLGFPLAVTLAWFFDFTRSGIHLDVNPWRRPAESDDRPSIAVLPFADMSVDGDQGYFCDGVAEEILNALTRVPQLRVLARSSSFQHGAGGGDVRRIGRALGVKTILEGSVRKADNHLRVTAQLINVADGYHLWSRNFDQELKDIFVIQDEIAKSIAESLLETITLKQQTAIKTTSSKDVTAYEFYLRGRQYINRMHKTDIKFARQMFRQAINLDPEFALAWAGCADCYSLMNMYEDPLDKYRIEARKASKKALELDPKLAEAHASRGLALLVSEDFAEAEAEFTTALELNSRLFQAYYYYGRARFHQGDLEGAAELFAKAAEVDPADYQSRCLRVQILRGIGRADEVVDEAREAVQVIEKHLEWNPDDARAYHLGAGSLIIIGELERAKRWLKRALEMDPDDSVLLYNVACNFATIGEVDQALDYLEQAIQHGVVHAAWMRNDADLEPLRSHPRYEALLNQLEGAAEKIPA